MEKLGRLVRWFFGIQALLALAIPYHVYVALRVYRTFTHIPPESLPADEHLFRSSILSTVLLVVGVYGLISISSALAWWSLKKGWSSARIWALLASASSLLSFDLSALAGIAGLAVFWKKDVVRAMADSAIHAGSPRHAAGDGTHKFIEKLAPFIMLVAWLFARVKWAQWGDHHGLPPSTLPGWLVVTLAIYVGVILHEAGHLFAGWGSDMVLRAFQLGPIAGQIRSGRWRFAFDASGLFGGGSVSMVPTHLKHIRGRKVLMILGGPVASLLTGAIATVLALTAHGSPWQPVWVFFALLGTIGLCDFLLNMTPLRPEGAYSDGAQIYQLMSSGPWADRHLASAMVASSLVTPLRPRDFDSAILVRAADSTPQGVDGLHYRMYLAMHHLDSGRLDEGTTAWRAAVAQDPQAAEKLSADTIAELAFYEAAIAGDLERAHYWWRRAESKGNSRKEIDYWKGRTAILLAEGHLSEAAAALHQASEIAQKLPDSGAYEYDRWCVDVLRRKMNSTDLERLTHATFATTLQMPVPAIS